MRTVIDLPEDRIAWLSAVCRRDHLSRGEAIRRAIDTATERDKNQRCREAKARGVRYLEGPWDRRVRVRERGAEEWER